MNQVRSELAQPSAPPRTTDDAALAADLARDLLTQPDSGVTGVSYVGLPERQAVQLVIDARYDGLRAQTTRGPAGRVSVILTVPPEPAEAIGPAPVPAPSAGAWRRAWARLWARSRRVARLPGREVP
jgi:hypothetical protein